MKFYMKILYFIIAQKSTLLINIQMTYIDFMPVMLYTIQTKCKT